MAGSSESRESREQMSREQFIREQLQNREQSMDQEPLRSPKKEPALLQNSSGQPILSNTSPLSQQSNQQNSHPTLENGSPTNTRPTGTTKNLIVHVYRQFLVVTAHLLASLTLFFLSS